LGVSAQSIENWVKADAVGGMKEAKGKPVNADQMEIARLKDELAKMRMERDILKRAAVGSTGQRNIFDLRCSERPPDCNAMPGSGCERQRLLSAPGTHRSA
jgi:transposase-like protein